MWAIFPNLVDVYLAPSPLRPKRLVRAWIAHDQKTWKHSILSLCAVLAILHVSHCDFVDHSISVRSLQRGRRTTNFFDCDLYILFCSRPVTMAHFSHSNMPHSIGPHFSASDEVANNTD